MFKRKSKLEVLKVKHETRELEVEDKNSYGFGGASSTKTTTTKKLNVTIVLAVKDGELVTREFNGKWDLEDVKKWEEL